MAQSSQTGGWQVPYDDRAAARSDHHEPASESRSSRAPSPYHSSINDTYESRRSRACEACRCSKVRCEQPNPNLPCKRCARARRECISSTRNQKRHKSLNFNDQLLELGGTIDHLITTMRTETERVRRVPDSNAASAEKNGKGTTVLEQRRISHDETMLPIYPSPKPSLDGGLPRQLQSPLAVASISNLQDSSGAGNINSISAFIETGIAQIISARTATSIFDRYRIELTGNFPAVVLDPATSAHQVRSNKLVLFLAILAAGSGGICDVDTQKRLKRLLTRVLAHCFLDEKEYTLELVQAFIVSALWHTPSEPIHGENSMDMQQLSHSAANVAIHIGLGKQSSTKNRQDLARRYGQDSQRLKPSQMIDLEARRTWLGCYYICANVSMPSQQPSLLCWNQYMDECIEALETSPLALPSDQQFCKHVRLQRATDEHSRNIFTTHFFRPGSISRPDTVEILVSFERQFANLANSTPNNTSNGATRLLYHSSALYLHEVVATIDRKVDSIDPNFEETQGRASHQLGAVPSAKSSYIPECLDSAHKVISTFTSLDLPDIRAMPTIFLVRVIHAISVLVKSSSSQNVDQDSGSHSPRRQYSRIDHQLDDLIEIMASWGSDWPACKLIKILIGLRKQLHENQDNLVATSGSLYQNVCSSEEDQDTQSSTPTFINLPTPLQYQSPVQETIQFGLEDFAVHQSMSYNESGYWENFTDLLPQYDKPLLLDSSKMDLWEAQQPQHEDLLSKETITTESMLDMELFPDNDGYTWLGTL